MTPWLSVIGVGAAGLGELGPAARTLVETAEVLVGGDRHLAMVADDHPAERRPWAPQLEATMNGIADARGRRVVVLASGDPMHYGIGAKLVCRFRVEEMIIVPAPGAFSLAAARLGWSLADVTTLSLHAQPIEALALHLAPARCLLALTTDGKAPAAAARLLIEHGYGPSHLTVLARLGATDEQRIEGTAESWRGRRVPDLNTLAIACRAGPDARLLPHTPGLPDDAFCHDGQITKREVRAVTLAALMPFPGQRLWDVGAGAGSIAIEWMRAAPGAMAVAIEREPQRAATIARNAGALGVPTLDIVIGAAPAALGPLATPEAIFIGGGVTAPGLPETCWEALAPAGRMVANAVTAEGEATLIRLRNELGGTLSRLAVSRAEPMGAFTGWRAHTPVTQWAATRPPTGKG